MKALKLLLIIGTSLACAPALAQDTAFPDEVDWKVSAYLWGMSLDGDAGIGDIVMPVDMDFSDILDVFDGGGSVILRRDQGAHTLIADVTYISLAPDTVQLPPGGVIDPGIDIFLFEGAYMHKRPVASGHWGFRGGFRYWDVDIDMGLSGSFMERSRSEGDDWLDGFVGLAGFRSISDRWSLIWTADIGAGDSDSTYTAQGIFQRKLKSGNLVTVGARYWKVDYDGSGGDAGRFLFDTDMYGFLVGFTFD